MQQSHSTVPHSTTRNVGLFSGNRGVATRQVCGRKELSVSPGSAVYI